MKKILMIILIIVLLLLIYRTCLKSDDPNKLCRMIPKVKEKLKPQHSTADNCFVSVPIDCENPPCDNLRTTIPCDEYSQ